MIEQTFQVREATESERRERDRASSEAWKRKLSLDQYLERLQRLREVPFTKNKIRSWVLQKGTLCVASCDTLRMPSVIAEPNTPGLSEVISRVYVEPGLRSKGYAAELLSQLIARARVEEVQATLLFTDIGERLYAQFGFRTMKGFNWVYAQQESEKNPAPELAVVEALKAADLNQVVPAAGLSSSGQFRLIADREQFDWHLKRAFYYAQAHKREPIETIGAKYGESFVLWAHDFLKNQLNLLWLEVKTREQAQHLMAASLREAFAYDFKRVLLAQSPTLNALVDFCRRAPAEDLPLILPISPELRAADWTEAAFAYQFKV